ncbi:MAG TPA: hypothetical protein DIW52_26330 [Pseudomonas sp.]|nr:hypothetical protein [Pseudomonas sp.]
MICTFNKETHRTSVILTRCDTQIQIRWATTGPVMCLSGRRIWPLLKHLREELLIVMGTASSDAVLPQIVRKLAVRMSSRASLAPTDDQVAKLWSTQNRRSEACPRRHHH